MYAYRVLSVSRLPPRLPGQARRKAERRPDRDIERTDDPVCEGAAEKAPDHHHQNHQAPGLQRQEAAETAAVASGADPVNYPPRCSVDKQLRLDRTDCNCAFSISGEIT